MEIPEVRTKKEPRKIPACFFLDPDRGLGGTHPEVGPEGIPGNFPSCLGLDQDREAWGARAAAGEDRVELRIRTAADFPHEGADLESLGEEFPDVKAGERLGDFVLGIHTFQNIPIVGTCKRERDIPPDGTVPDTRVMDDVWPNRHLFRRRLDAYLAAPGNSQASFAAEVGISLKHLRNTIYDPKIKFSFPVLQRAAAVFGCSVSEFTGDPTVPVAGQDLSSLSEQARVFASLIVMDLQSKDLTDDDRRWLLEDFQRGLDRLRLLHSARTREDGADRDRSGRMDDGTNSGIEPADRSPRRR